MAVLVYPSKNHSNTQPGDQTQTDGVNVVSRIPRKKTNMFSLRNNENWTQKILDAQKTQLIFYVSHKNKALFSTSGYISVVMW